MTRRGREEGDPSQFQKDLHGDPMDPLNVLTEVCPYFDGTTAAS